MINTMPCKHMKDNRCDAGLVIARPGREDHVVQRPAMSFCKICPKYDGPPREGLVMPMMITARKKPIPRDQWPLWAKAIAIVAVSGDVGVGDTVYHRIGEANSEAFKMWHLATFGKDCGCGSRRETWNQQYPYNPTPSSKGTP